MLRAQLILADFAATDWRMTTDPGPPLAMYEPQAEVDDEAAEEAAKQAAKQPATPRETAEILQTEIAALMNKREQRNGRMAEIVSHSASFTSCFTALLGLQDDSKPHTRTLIHTGIAVGMMAVLHWKEQYARARPAAVFPLLVPAIATPPHPAYPSGHGTQAFLVARLVAGALDEGPLASELLEVLKAMAERIAVNREVAGLHYFSDTEAGRRLALMLAPMVLGLKRVREDVIPGVRAEWKAVQAGPPPANIAAWDPLVEQFAKAAAREAAQEVANAIAAALPKPGAT